jgi:hypothetical protein
MAPCITALVEVGRTSHERLLQILLLLLLERLRLCNSSSMPVPWRQRTG